MIGLFKITKIDGEKVIAKSEMNADFVGTFYVPPLYRQDCSELAINDIFFGVLDDASGLGAMLYKINDGVGSNNALNLSHDLNVKGNITVDNNTEISGNENINGNLKVVGTIGTSSTITGKSPITQINLTAAHAALIFASALSGSPAPLPAVDVEMTNGG